MAQSRDPEWTEEDSIPRADADPLEQLRESILRLLNQGVLRGEIFDNLIQQGYRAEYASGLIDSVMQTGKHDSLISGTATYHGGNLVRFEEDSLSKRRRRIAERGQRKIREIKAEAVDAPAELCFDEAVDQREALHRSGRSFIRRWLLITVGVGSAVEAALYWLTQ
jgi:hypothetical protein